MKNNGSHSCNNMRDQLSAKLDGHLSRDDDRKLSQHLQSCESCSLYWGDLSNVSNMTRNLKLDPINPPSWNQIRHYISEAKPTPKQTYSFFFYLLKKPVLTGMAITIFSAAIIFSLSTPHLYNPFIQEKFNSPLGKVLKLYLDDSERAVDPIAFETLAKEILLQKTPTHLLAQNVNFEPFLKKDVADFNLPEGFRFDSSYVFTSKCCNGIHYRFMKGAEVVALFQLPPKHPLELEKGEFVETKIDGVNCKKARSGKFVIFQIDPRGNNITVIAKKGAVDIEKITVQIVASTSK